MIDPDSERLMMLAMCFVLNKSFNRFMWLNDDIAKEVRDELSIRIGL